MYPRFLTRLREGQTSSAKLPWSFRQELLLHSVEWPDHRVMEGRNAPLAIVHSEDTQAELL
jgi:hypothetical protein